MALANHLLQPNSDYACIVYDSLTDCLDNKLLKLQNRCIRYIYYIRGEHFTPIRKKLGWLTPRNHRNLFIGNLTYKLTYQRPNYLYQSLIQYKANPSRSLRSNLKKFFDIPLPRSAAFDGSFQFRAIRLWNDLPSKVVSAPNIGPFRSQLFKYLLSIQNDEAVGA